MGSGIRFSDTLDAMLYSVGEITGVIDSLPTSVDACSRRSEFSSIATEFPKKLQGEWKLPLGVDKIIYNGPCTIVFWSDGTKTVVKCGYEEEFSEYTGFIAAVSKKVFGSTSAVKKIIKKKRKE